MQPCNIGGSIARSSAFRPARARWPGRARLAREARELESTTFIAHVRYATTGAIEARNTHPFEQRGRLALEQGHMPDAVAAFEEAA